LSFSSAFPPPAVPLVHPAGLLNVADKGMVWIHPGMDYSISFDIPKDALRYAREITFVGQTAVGKKNGEVWVVTPDRELTVTYDVRTTEFSVKENKDDLFAPLSL